MTVDQALEALYAVYNDGENGDLQLISAASGEPIEAFTITGTPYGNVVIAGGHA